ncbi:hypothetical protein [Amycolatopsis sp. NPDC059657]|uniref:hypothetical protein n=1 Tax=Amycolatopsis sp. NPDC059657 TaxID=3346899 RepID=UPI00366FE966
MDGAVHTAAAEQRLIRGRDHAVDLLASDVAEYNLDLGHVPIMASEGGRQGCVLAHGEPRRGCRYRTSRVD